MRKLCGQLRCASLFIIFSGIFMGIACAETGQGVKQTTAIDHFDSFWQGAVLYQNPQSKAVQSLSLVGRYHGQYWSVDADQGTADGWDNRRMIFGVNAQFLSNYVFDLQMHLNDDFSPVYDGLYTASIKWVPPGKGVSASLGRLDYVYTGMERSTSSKKIVTFERGLLSGQLMPGEVVGLYTGKDLDALSMRLGIYSGDIGDELSDFDAGVASGIGFGYKLPVFFDKGTLHLDYLYNDGNPDNNAFEPYRQIFSIWHRGQKGPFGLSMDYTRGQGQFDHQPDIDGFTLIPTYNLSRDLILGGDMLQLAMRYQYARSDGNNGLQVPRRYEREVTTGYGDHYQAFYIGLNYLIYGDQLKLMAGAEYSDLQDAAEDGGEYSGWTYLAGLRLFF